GAQRMRQIILDLLNYSRAGSIVDDPTEIDLNIVVNDIMKLHDSLITELGATINSEKLPKVWGHKTPIYQIFQNLINNALKYTQEHVKTLIEIRANDQP